MDGFYTIDGKLIISDVKQQCAIRALMLVSVL